MQKDITTNVLILILVNHLRQDFVFGVSFFFVYLLYETSSVNANLFAFLRRDEKTDLYDVSFENYPSLGTIGIESAGKETIFDMVTNRFRTFGVKNCKPQFENMVFLNANGDCLNIGLPVGVLSTTKTYTCIFKKGLVFQPSDFKRRYAVHDYNSNWKLGHFFVSFSPIARVISQFSTIVHTRMQVDFFDNETLFESLMRDGRFNEEELRCCVVKQGRTPLSYKAKHFQGKCVKIRYLKEKDTKLPELVLPQLHPDPFKNTSTVTPSKVKQESTSGVSSSSLISLTPLDASTPRPTSMPVESRKNSGQWIELSFKVSCKELKVKNVRKLSKQLKEFENFAQEQGLRCYARELKELAEILQSVGAIFQLDIAKQPRLVGTCFRIGTVYILTNNHVSEKIAKSQGEENEIFVDFNFEEAGESHSERQSIGKLVVNCKDLDYAIFGMNEPPEKLPRCIFSHGVSIMDPEKGDWRMLAGKPVRLIGHPQSEPKQVDLKCIVDARPQSGLECYAYTARRGEQFEGEAAKDYHEIKDRRRGTYQSSDFFHGSSGSPGLVLLNNRKWLVFLHTRGFKTSRGKFYIEQGVLLTEVFKDVRKKIEQAQRDSSRGDNLLNDIRLEDLFPSVDGVTQGSRVEPMEH